MKQTNIETSIAFKRSYEITPLDVGHPLYLENPDISRYEIIIKQGSNHAIVYADLIKEENILLILEGLEKLNWLELDAMNRYSMHCLRREIW